jgi:hypothetical protein
MRSTTMKSCTISGRSPALRLVWLAAALLPAACATPAAPPDPFAGGWATAEHQEIAFGGNSVVLHPPGEAPTPMSAASCSGAFRFDYSQKSREALLGLAPSQPDLKRRLERLLVRPDYRVAEVTCGEGASTYVLLDDRDLLAIHRDQGIAGIETMTRL